MPKHARHQVAAEELMKHGQPGMSDQIAEALHEIPVRVVIYRHQRKDYGQALHAWDGVSGSKPISNGAKGH
jgi:hypothetical protein